MSAEEAALLARVRTALRRPPRRPILIDDLSLEDAFREYWRVFEIEPSEETLNSLRRKADDSLAPRVTFRSETAAPSEVIAAICNQTGMLIGSGLYGYWLDWDRSTSMRNRCVAVEGMIFQLRFLRDPERPLFEVTGKTSLEGFRPAQTRFELEAALLPGGVDAGQQLEHQMRIGFFSLAVDLEAWRAQGEWIEELRGTVAQPVPLAMRRIELQPEVGKTVVREEDGRSLTSRCSPAADGSWELEITLAQEFDDLLDADAETELVLADPGARPDARFRHSRGRSSVTYQGVPPGTRVVWTYASESEVLRVPVVWRSIGAGVEPSARR
jgi:hypothetical protein